MAWTQVYINIIDGGRMNKDSYIYIYIQIHDGQMPIIFAF